MLMKKTLLLCAVFAVTACGREATGIPEHTSASDHAIRRDGGSASAPDTTSENNTSSGSTGGGQVVGDGGNGTLGSGY